MKGAARVRGFRWLRGEAPSTRTGVGLLASATLHGGLAVVVLLLVTPSPSLPPLFIDLTVDAEQREIAPPPRAEQGGPTPPRPRAERAELAAPASPVRTVRPEVPLPPPAPRVVRPASPPLAPQAPAPRTALPEPSPVPAPRSSPVAPAPPSPPTPASTVPADVVPPPEASARATAERLAGPGPGPLAPDLAREPLAPAAVAAPPAPPSSSMQPGTESSPARTSPARAAPAAPPPESTATAAGVAGGAAVGAARDAGRAQQLARATSSGAIGKPGPEHDAWLRDLRGRIQSALHYPPSARRRGISGTVTLEMTVQPSGAIENVRVVESSSHRVLDSAAVDGVRALPALPMPGGLEGRTLRVRLPVVFELR